MSGTVSTPTSSVARRIVPPHRACADCSSGCSVPSIHPIGPSRSSAGAYIPSGGTRSNARSSSPGSGATRSGGGSGTHDFHHESIAFGGKAADPAVPAAFGVGLFQGSFLLHYNHHQQVRHLHLLDKTGPIVVTASQPPACILLKTKSSS